VVLAAAEEEEQTALQTLTQLLEQSTLAAAVVAHEITQVDTLVLLVALEL